MTSQRKGSRVISYTQHFIGSTKWQLKITARKQCRYLTYELLLKVWHKPLQTTTVPAALTDTRAAPTPHCPPHPRQTLSLHSHAADEPAECCSRMPRLDLSPCTAPGSTLRTSLLGVTQMLPPRAALCSSYCWQKDFGFLNHLAMGWIQSPCLHLPLSPLLPFIFH